ncbi:hypothetical protein ACFOVU_14395 [Nocardiopsis sediminis]|uniref:DUF8129 domain-containing protein n=1 Tax=Nocardiopsis sediminis TaxID=1778267 RepID=A0ABV8FLU1_9ACTN
MSNPSIASKLISAVKGIFGPKEAKEGAAAGTAASGTAAPAATTDEAAVKTSAPAEAETAAATTETATAPAPRKAGDDTPAPAEGETAVKEPVSAAPADAKADAEPAAVPGQDDSDPELVAPEEKAAIADELEAASAATQIASDEVLEKVRKEASPAAEDLAVPGYDGLSLPSIRARLRKLTLEEVRELRAYEVAHGERPEFIKMYDNRIAKLQSEPAAE